MIIKYKRKFLIFIISSWIVTSLLSCEQFYKYDEANKLEISRPANVAVMLYRANDEYIAEVRNSLENIQANNPDKVQYTFFDAMGNQDIQNQSINKVLKEGVDLLLVNLVDIEDADKVLNRIKETNTPVILFNREPFSLDPVKSYSKSCFIGTYPQEAGILQGKILTREWNNNKVNIDRNGDNIMQYVMLTGNSDNREAIGRTKYSVLTVTEAGINVQELGLRVCNWDRQLARRATEALLFRYGNSIEAVISNNDAMAIGAIEALQSMGFNNGNPSRTVAVVGVDAIEEAKELIAKGYMTGTVVQDDTAMAEALYLVGMNFVEGKNPLENTNYKFDETGVAIRLPYKEYIVERN